MDTAKQITIEISTKHGLSDSEIAERVGIVCSQPTIWRIRNGETKTCRSDLYIELMKLRDSLKKNLDQESRLT